MRAGAIAAAGRERNLRAGSYRLADSHRHAISAQMPVPGVVSPPMIDYDVIRRLPLPNCIAIELAVVGIGDGSIERGEHWHSDILLAERAQIDVMTLVTVVSEIGAIPIQDSRRGIKVNEVVYESILPFGAGDGHKRV